MTNISQPVPIPSEAIDSDTPCRRCGYNLRGLFTDGQCPECGTLVRLALRQDLLEHSDPAWLDSLRHGIVWMLWYMGVMVVFVVTYVILLTHKVRFSASPVTILSTVIALMYAWGRYLATKPDPSGLGEADYGRVRKLVRVTILISLMSLVLSAVRTAALTVPELMTVITVLGAIAETVAIVGLFAQLHYFEKLTLRIPDAGLSQRSRFLKFAMGISGAIVVALLILQQVEGRAALRARGVRTVVSCGWILGGLPLVIFVLMYVNLLGRLSARLRQLSQVARKSWASAG